MKNKILLTYFGKIMKKNKKSDINSEMVKAYIEGYSEGVQDIIKEIEDLLLIGCNDIAFEKMLCNKLKQFKEE